MGGARAAAAAGAADPERGAAGVAAAGGDHVLPLRDEHLHGLRVGHGCRVPGPVRPGRAQRHPVDGRRRGRRRLPRHPRRQAPRRLLPLALRLHGPLRARQPLARRRQRPRARVHQRRPRQGRRPRPLPLALGPPRRAVRPRGRVQRVLPRPAPRAPHRLRRGVGDLVRRRQGQERHPHDLPFPGVVPDREAAAGLHQHLLRRRPRHPLGRRREGLRRSHLLVHRQPLLHNNRRRRHREVHQRGRSARHGLGTAGVRRVDPAGVVLAPQRDGQAAEPAAQDILQLGGPELRAAAERAAQHDGPGGGRRHRQAPRVPRRRHAHLPHGPCRGQHGEGQQRARRRLLGAQRARRVGRGVLGAQLGGGRVLDRAAAAGGEALQRGEDTGARDAGAARGAAPGVRGRRGRGQRHHGGAQAAAPAGPPRRRPDGEGMVRGAAWGAARVGGGPPPRPLRNRRDVTAVAARKANNCCYVTSSHPKLLGSLAIAIHCTKLHFFPFFQMDPIKIQRLGNVSV